MIVKHSEGGGGWIFLRVNLRPIQRQCFCRAISIYKKKRGAGLKLVKIYNCLILLHIYLFVVIRKLPESVPDQCLSDKTHASSGFETDVQSYDIYFIYFYI